MKTDEEKVVETERDEKVEAEEKEEVETVEETEIDVETGGGIGTSGDPDMVDIFEVVVGETTEVELTPWATCVEPLAVSATESDLEAGPRSEVV